MSVRWPRLLTPTHLSQLIRSQKNPLKALDVFNEAKTRYPRYRHNGPVYATMINILGASGRMTEMKEIINRMKKDSCVCQDLVFAGIITTYTNAGMLDDAIALFKSLPEFNCVNFTHSFNTLLEILVRDSRLETCYHFFVEHCHGWEIKSRTFSLNLLMDALCWMHRSDLALHIFQEMGNQWCIPERETYRILMRGLCADGRLTEATQLLYLMFFRISRKGSGADVSIYRALLEALCDNGEIDKAVELLGKVLRKGLKVPKQYFKKLDLSQLHENDKSGINKTKALINESLVGGGVRSTDSYRAMAIDLYSEGKIVDGDKVLQEMHKKGFQSSLPIYKAKITALFAAGEVGEAVHVEKEMIESNCVPTIQLHNLVIKGLCNARQSDMALRYFEKMRKQVGCVPNRETYSYLVDELCCDSRYMEASGMMEKMLINSFWPDEKMYSKLISGLCLIGKPYKAVVWLDEMISQAKVPEMSVWCSLVSAVCCERQQKEMIREEDEEIEAEGTNYQLEMMRCLREVNVHSNTVGCISNGEAAEGTWPQSSSPPVKKKVEAKLGELKDTISSGSTQSIKDAMAALNQEVMQLGQSL